MDMARFRLIVWLLAAFMAGVLSVLLILGRNEPVASTAIPLAPLEGTFSLKTQTGTPFTEANLSDKPSVVFFGFTNCPDICPTGLAELTDLLAKLGPDGDRIQILFVAVDSRRDTLETVRDYLTSFDPRIVGLTGAKQDIDKAVATFKAFYEIVPGSGPDDYTVNHTAGMYLIDREKRFIGKLDAHESVEVRLEKLRRLIGR
jgi:protein SCO1